MVSFKTHVSQAYVTTGLIKLQYNFNFDFVETNLLLKIYPHISPRNTEQNPQNTGKGRSSSRAQWSQHVNSRFKMKCSNNLSYSAQHSTCLCVDRDGCFRLQFEIIDFLKNGSLYVYRISTSLQTRLSDT